MNLENLKELYVNELRDLYNAEGQLVKALPKMAKGASSDELKEAFEKHLEQTNNHVQRLEQVFEELGAPYGTVDVLSDPEVREEIKAYSSWPTIPQVYIDGKFVGGCDIVRELYETGELQQLVKSAPSQSA